MFTKLKTFLVAAVVIASLPIISTANNGDNGKAHDKVTLCHNGHLINISRAARQKHLDLHNRQGAKLTCFEVTASRPCGSGPTKPPTECHHDPEEVCTGCQ